MEICNYLDEQNYTKKPGRGKKKIHKKIPKEGKGQLLRLSKKRA